MGVEIIDNFLPEKDFSLIQEKLLSTDIQWYFSNYTCFNGDGRYQFTHSFYEKERGGQTSSYFPIFETVVRMLGVKDLYRIKANLNPRTFFKTDTGYHYDYPNMMTAVLYINNNNGGTKFKGGKFVRSVENRIVVFDSNLVHAGITCTDEHRRVMVNFNFEN